MTKKEQARRERLLPEGKPRYIRCYDNGGETLDRYTVVYTGRYRGDGWFQYISMNSSPFHPQGIGQHGEHPTQIDRPSYGHLGKKITFDDLPEDCQKLVMQDYNAIWGLA